MKKSSLKANLTTSQWLAVDTLSSMLKGPLPLFSLVGNSKSVDGLKFARANMTRVNLWELLQKRIHVEHRIVEECSYEFKPIVVDAEDEGIKRRDVIFNVRLIVKTGVGLPCLINPLHLFLRIKIEMFGDCGEWHVRKITFIPQSQDQLNTIFRQVPINYKIV